MAFPPGEFIRRETFNNIVRETIKMYRYLVTKITRAKVTLIAVTTDVTGRYGPLIQVYNVNNEG